MRIAFLCLFCCAFFFVQPDRFFFYDDINYARYALQLATGFFSINGDNFSFRLGAFAPTALFYKVFGVGIYTTALPSLCWHLATGGMVYWLLGKWGHKNVRLLAAGIVMLDFYSIFYSNKLYPDTPLAFWVLCMCYLSAQASKGDFRAQALKGSLWAVCFAIAFVTKLTVYLALPFFAYQGIRGLWKKQPFWYYASLGTGIWAVGYGLYFWKYFDNPFYLFQQLSANQYVNHCSYHLQPAWAMARRLTYDFWAMLLSTGLAFTFAPALAGVCFWKILTTQGKYWMGAFICTLLSYQFLSTSWEYYLPMCLEGRHFIPLVPLSGMAMGTCWETLRKQRTYTFGLGFLYLAFAALAYTAGVGKLTWVYAGAGCVGLIWAYWGQAEKWCGWAAFMLLLLHPAYTMLKPTQTGFHAQHYMMQKYFSAPQKAVVFADDMLVSGGHIHLKLDSSFVKFQDIRDIHLLHEGAYILLNDFSVHYLETYANHKIRDAFNKIEAQTVLLEATSGIRLYRYHAPPRK